MTATINRQRGILEGTNYEWDDEPEDMPSFEEAVAPAPHEDLCAKLWDQSIPLHSQYRIDPETGEKILTCKGRDQYRDEFFSRRPGFQPGRVNEATGLITWQRRGERRYCDVDGDGTIYTFDVRRVEVEGPHGFELAWVTDIYDTGVGGTGQPRLIKTLLKRTAQGEVPFANGQEANTAAYQWLRNVWTPEVARAFVESPAGQACLERQRQHAQAQADAQREAARQEYKRLQAIVLDTKEALKSADTEEEREALYNLLRDTKEQAQALVAQYTGGR